MYVHTVNTINKMPSCFLKLSTILLIFHISCVHLLPTSSNQQPNIVIIMADDMGFDDVSFRGAQEFLTPNIDALGYHGRILDRLYAPPMCTPSRGALLTARYPIHTGTQHFVISNEEPWGLPTNVTTIAEVFQRAGYATNLIGKWHLGFAKEAYTPTRRGFDYHYGYWGAYVDYYQRRAKMPVANYSLGYDFRRNLAVECPQPGVYMTDLLTQEAERIILSSNADADAGAGANAKPLFLLLNHLAVHTANDDDPMQAPQAVVDRFKHIQDPNRRKYAAMVAKLDESVGRIVNALARAGTLENTIVLFYSDNGAPSVGTFANTGKNWPLKGQKNTPWEGGVRVAGVIWSSLLQQRANIFRPAMYVGDWLPTLAHAANIQLSAELLATIDGVDMWPQLIASDSANANANANDHASDSIVGDDETEREILHVLDDVWGMAAYTRGRYKYINGSFGTYDQVLTQREIYEVDPRAQRYVVEVRNSAVSKALSGFDKQRLTRHRIENLRQAAAVRCGDGPRRTCNRFVEACLYDLEVDPCEQNNLVYEPQYASVLQAMAARVEALRRTAWPLGNRAGQWQYDPTRHACTWTNFLEEPPTRIAHDCEYTSLPCDAKA